MLLHLPLLVLGLLSVVTAINAQCTNRHQFCQFWAKKGECESNADFMKSRCPRACGECETPKVKTTAATKTTRGAPRTTSSPGTTAARKKDPRLVAARFAAAPEKTTKRPAATKATKAPSPPVQNDIPNGTPRVKPIPTLSPPPKGKAGRRTTKTTASTTTSTTTTSTTTSRSTRRTTESVVLEDCKDGSQFCGFWASVGECRNNAAWMNTNCHRSCSGCAGPSSSRVAAPQTQRSETTSRDDPVRCMAIHKNFSRSASQRLRDEGLITTREGSRNGFSTFFVLREANSNGCAPSTRAGNLNCTRDLCFNLNFRSMDGSCNNMNNPDWGASFAPYIRLLPPEYDDDRGAPVGTVRRSRPSTRDVTRNLLSSSQVFLHDGFNMLLMQWGQFITHDMSRTSQPARDSCFSCQPDQRCFPAPVPNFDPLAGVFQGCIKIARDFPTCGSTPREQLNENTAFLDASHIYGSSVDDNLSLRDPGSPFVRMDSGASGRLVIPFNHNECPNPQNCPKLSFHAGDDRANVFLSLAALHIFFAREHNRIAAILRQLNPQWDGDRTFNEARKIVGAEIQVITFNEYLPKIFGSRFSDAIGSYGGYNESVNPTIASVFATAAFRFGHGMITDNFASFKADGSPAINTPITFADWVEHSERMRDETIDDIMRGLMLSRMKRPQRLAPATGRIFDRFDLGAINIQRGRDHGLPSYNSWRKFCKIPTADSIDDLAGTISNQFVRTQLRNLYGNPDNIDLYVALLLEDPVDGALVGPTLICLLSEQFKKLRAGDRFWFENPGIFTDDQLSELKGVTLSRVLCDNGDFMQFAPADAFRFTGLNGFTSCRQLPSINFQAWKD